MARFEPGPPAHSIGVAHLTVCSYVSDIHPPTAFSRCLFLSRLGMSSRTVLVVALQAIR